MSLNVLIVDDSAAMRSIIQKTLQISGLEIGHVYQAKNGEEALVMLEENWVDLALVDINMPVMDGETLINRVRENPDLAELPIVVVSTESSEARIVQLRSKDVEFIHKPFAPETLRETVFQITGVDNGTSTLPSSNFDF
ncbi:MAG: response regulator [Acidobacteria bacterium]|nr:response regulator [Acidobacteriota bacterium]